MNLATLLICADALEDDGFAHDARRLRQSWVSHQRPIRIENFRGEISGWYNQFAVGDWIYAGTGTGVFARLPRLACDVFDEEPWRLPFAFPDLFPRCFVPMPNDAERWPRGSPYVAPSNSRLGGNFKRLRDVPSLLFGQPQEDAGGAGAFVPFTFPFDGQGIVLMQGSLPLQYPRQTAAQRT